jgi:hypothetical protein
MIPENENEDEEVVRKRLRVRRPRAIDDILKIDRVSFLLDCDLTLDSSILPQPQDRLHDQDL